MPYFSIIIPAYNRERSLARALASVLAQDFASYEVIVVDDASTDGTLAVAQKCPDPRVRTVARPTNGGPCQTRNSGVDSARGEWLLMLDSDFSLRAGALTTLQQWCESAAPATGNCISACQWDNGWLTPRPMPPSLMDYEGYLEWIETVEISEYLNCVRREVFDTIRYSNSRAWEGSFHLGLVRRWTLEFHPEAFVLVHTDATNRLTTGMGASARQRLLADAPDKLADGLALLAEHGEALRRSAPGRLAALRRDLIKQALLAGRRTLAARIALNGLCALRWDPRLVVIVGAGLIHRRLLAELNSRPARSAR